MKNEATQTRRRMMASTVSAVGNLIRFGSEGGSPGGGVTTVVLLSATVHAPPMGTGRAGGRGTRRTSCLAMVAIGWVMEHHPDPALTRVNRRPGRVGTHGVCGAGRGDVH